MAEETNTPETPATLSESRVHQLINSALASQKKELERKAKEDREAFSKMLDEKLGALKPAEPAAPGEGGKKAKDVELDSLRRQMQELQGQLQEQRDVAQRELQKNRTSQMHSVVQERLAEMGKITGTGAKLALMALTASGRVGYGEGDESEKLVYRGDDGVTVDLETGLKQWLKTEEAKYFQAPSGARGSGSRPGAAPAGPATGNPMNNAMGYLEKALRSEFRGVDQIDTE